MQHSDRILVVVESPSKTTPIKKYLSDLCPNVEFVVEASCGHVRDLEKKNMGVDKDTIEPIYVIDAGKLRVVKKLQGLMKTCSTLYLATDNDREGEAIAWHLHQLLKPRQYKRLVFNEITKQGIATGLTMARGINEEYVASQKARRMIDRVMGFSLSPLLWKAFKCENGSILAAGRVQSAALHMIQKREERVRAAQAYSPYWEVVATLKGRLFQTAHLCNASTLARIRFHSVEECETHMRGVTSIFTPLTSRLFDEETLPDLPYTTSSLQQDAFNKLGFTCKKTMQVAQKLYENGHITYMRTDSTHMCTQAVADVKQYVSTKYGAEYCVDMPHTRKTTTKTKSIAQMAHEAIRPTRMMSLIPSISEKGEQMLYDLIFKRTIASQMKSAVARVRLAVMRPSPVQASHACFQDMCYVARVSRLAFVGFKAVHDATPQDTRELEMPESELEVVEATVLNANNEFETGPKRFNEGSLVKELEKTGIGRPSTYATTLDKLYVRGFIELKHTPGQLVDATHAQVDLHTGKMTRQASTFSMGSEKQRIVPSAKGELVSGFLAGHFHYLIDDSFTSTMERQLDAVAQGSLSHKNVVADFWKTLDLHIMNAKNSLSPQKKVIELEEKEFVVNGEKVVVRIGKHGPHLERPCMSKDDPRKFVSLKTFCQMTKQRCFDLNEADIYMLTSLPITVPDSGGASLRYGRYGFYLKRPNGEACEVPVHWVMKRFGRLSEIIAIQAHDVDDIVNGNHKSNDPKHKKAKNKSKYDPVARKALKLTRKAKL